MPDSLTHRSPRGRAKSVGSRWTSVREGRRPVVTVPPRLTRVRSLLCGASRECLARAVKCPRGAGATRSGDTERRKNRATWRVSHRLPSHARISIKIGDRERILDQNLGVNSNHKSVTRKSRQNRSGFFFWKDREDLDSRDSRDRVAKKPSAVLSRVTRLSR